MTQISHNILFLNLFFGGVELIEYKESTDDGFKPEVFQISSRDHNVLFESRREKLILNISSVILLLVLLFLWIWYR